jgi:hypothetical protein
VYQDCSAFFHDLDSAGTNEALSQVHCFGLVAGLENFSCNSEIGQEYNNIFGSHLWCLFFSGTMWSMSQIPVAMW